MIKPKVMNLNGTVCMSRARVVPFPLSVAERICVDEISCFEPLGAFHESGWLTSCSPSPRPSPLGRGRIASRSGTGHDALVCLETRATWLPLPKGEGWGAGEGTLEPPLLEAFSRSIHSLDSNER